MLQEGQKYLLALNRHPKIGSRRLFELKKQFGEWCRVWGASERELKAKVGDELAAIVVDAKKKFVPDREAEIIGRIGARIVEHGEVEYPKALTEIPDPPAFLYVKGSLVSLEQTTIAVVGSRRATTYGYQVTERIVRPLAASGITIISGLALGIDTAAHQAAVNGRGKTIGVLGCGLEQIYPQSNTDLANKMIEGGGAVISEFAPGVPSYRSNFPIRNRIVAGLARLTIVVEAMARSGALITARAALEYNRDVGAVPGDITREQAEGPNLLIKQGAAVITSADDVLEILGLEVGVSDRLSVIGDRGEGALKTENLNKLEKQIWEKLTREPKHIDQLAKELKLDIAATNSTLVMLELNGFVKRLGGNFYVKNC
jgi:DNA processing protein